MPIEINNLSFSYRKGTPLEKDALLDISLNIEDGELVGLIGPTQSGKTTLAQHFNALLIPRKGKVIVNGCDTAAKNVDLKSLRQQVGYVFQNPDYQLFCPTVGEDIAFGPKNQGHSPETTKKIVSESMFKVGLDEKLFTNRDIFALSGGQKRRVAIAGVLACKPEILILDDVTAGLDPRGREEILKLIGDLHYKERVTIIYISNSMDEIALLAKRIIVMGKGRIVRDDSADNIFSDPSALRKAGLQLPELADFSERMKAKGFSFPSTILDFEETVKSVTSLFKKGGELD